MNRPGLRFFKSIFCFVLCMIATLPAFAAKTDVVILKNGDYITGELKRMEFARLSYSTDAMKTLSIEWDQIKYLKANQTFRIELENGYDFAGSIDTDTLNNRLIIKFDSLYYKTSFHDVVKIIPIEDTFLKRSKLSLDLGFSYTKASDIAQLTSNVNGSYRSWNFRHELKFNSIVTAKKDSNSAQNIDLTWNTSRFFIYKWFLNGFIGAQRNTELGLNLRLLIGAGGGKDLYRTNTNLLTTGGGLQVTQEWKNDSKDSETNLEGLVTLNHQKFQYVDPEIDLNTTITVYPSITNWGRIRFNLNTNLSWEIWDDFFWKLTLYDNYDNEPSTEGDSKNDYGVTFSFGWKY